jgi:hypothetical protein
MAPINLDALTFESIRSGIQEGAKESPPEDLLDCLKNTVLDLFFSHKSIKRHGDLKFNIIQESSEEARQTVYDELPYFVNSYLDRVHRHLDD